MPYRDPPTHSRFPKGRSGNPAGRPKRTSLAEEVAAELSEQVALADGALITKARAVAKTLIAAALKGDLRAVQTVLSIAPSPASAEAAGELDERDAKILSDLIAKKGDAL